MDWTALWVSVRLSCAATILLLVIGVPVAYWIAFSRWRWSVALERCRNGRTGEWVVEWDHVAHRFRLVEGVADRAPHQRAGLRYAG